jgi:hypothetical protein
VEHWQLAIGNWQLARGHETLKICLVSVFDCIYVSLLPAPVQNTHLKKTPVNFAM